MANQIINVTSAPNQRFSVSLAVNGGTINLQLSLSFNAMGEFWVLNIFTPSGIPIMLSVPLVTGVWPAANILSPFQYLNIGSCYVINVTGADADLPGATSLGSDFTLLWGDNTTP